MDVVFALMILGNLLAISLLATGVRKVGIWRGYRGPTIAIGAMAISIIIFVVSLLTATASFDEGSPTVEIVAYLLLPYLIMAGLAVLVALLPMRPSWVPGPRRSRFPYQGVSKFAWAFAAFVAFAGLVTALSTGIFDFALGGFSMGAACMAYAKDGLRLGAEATVGRSQDSK